MIAPEVRQDLRQNSHTFGATAVRSVTGQWAVMVPGNEAGLPYSGGSLVSDDTVANWTVLGG